MHQVTKITAKRRLKKRSFSLQAQKKKTKQATAEANRVDMCHAMRCRTCGKTTWFGCSLHSMYPRAGFHGVAEEAKQCETLSPSYSLSSQSTRP